MKKILTTAAVSLALCSVVSYAADFKPAVAYDSSGKFDKSFSQAVFENGTTRYMDETNTHITKSIPGFLMDYITWPCDVSK